jgi:c(7)-type cytochrome triheme protein
MQRRTKYIPESLKRSSSSRYRRQILTFVGWTIFVGVLLLSCSAGKDEAEKNSATAGPDNIASLPANSNTSEIDAIKALTNSLQGSEKLSKFEHGNQYHSQLSCLICHRRDNNSARVSLPGNGGHTPCIGCHTQQFADNKSPICAICHTDAETGAMKRFPPLRSFNVQFDHGKHMQNANCATCHKPAQRGVALSIPSGANAHATCFQCHSSEASHNMASCGLCHEPGRKGGTPSESKNIFAVFSHAKHKLSCVTCHSVKAGASRGSQVTAPVAAMHFASKNSISCGGCHNGKRTFGGADFSNCKRCHQGSNFKF